MKRPPPFARPSMRSNAGYVAAKNWSTPARPSMRSMPNLTTPAAGSARSTATSACSILASTRREAAFRRLGPQSQGARQIQHELELLKVQRSKLEDQLLEVMSRLETVEASHSSVASNLPAPNSSESSIWQNSSSRRSGWRCPHPRRCQARGSEAQDQPAGSSRLRKHPPPAGSMAVAHIQAGMCAGCRVTIPEAIRRRAFQPDQLAQCPNCERILFVG